MWAALFLICLLCLMDRGSAKTAVNAAGKNLTRTICYSGSTMYQQFTQVCQTLNPAYKGDWYCSKVDVCEFGMSANRDCITTKGCAREDECYTTGSAATGVLYDGSQVLSNTIGSLPAGMKVKPACCLNKALFPTDDATIAYATICNSASRIVSSSWSWWLTLLLAMTLMHYVNVNN